MINYGLNSYFIKHEVVGKKCSILILGESHIKTGINPILFPDAQNIAQPAENIMLTFYKLKKVHYFHKYDIKNIILGIGHNTFSGFNDTKLKDKHFAHEFMERVYPIMSFSQMNVEKVDWRIYVKSFLKNMLLFPRKKHDKYIGSFNPKNNTKNSLTAQDYINRHFYKEDKFFGISDNSIIYLDSIIEYCNNNKLQLNLVYTPQQKEYLDLIPEEINHVFDSLKIEIKNKEIPFLDYHEMELDKIYFSDYDHLNAKGADLFTREVVGRFLED